MLSSFAFMEDEATKRLNETKQSLIIELFILLHHLRRGNIPTYTKTRGGEL